MTDASVRQGPTLTDLEHKICRQFPQLDRFRLLGLDDAGELPRRYLGLGRVAAQLDPGAHDDLCLSLTGALATRGLTVSPVILSASAWDALEAQAPQAGWIDCLQPIGGACKQVQLTRDRVPQPRALREWLLRLVRERGALLSTLEQAELPVQSTLQLCVTVAEEALQLSFALAGTVFQGDARALASARELADRLPLGAAEVQGYFALIGQLERARLVERLLGDSDQHAPDPRRALAFAARLLGRLEQVARIQLTTAEDRRRARRRKIAFGLTAVIALAAGVVGYRIVTAPREPLADMSRITKPGAIRGKYYKGTNFDKFVFERDDAPIRLSGTGSPDPRLPSDMFSARWQGYLRFKREGPHTLCVESDDGGQLYLDGERIAGEWKRHSRQRSCAEVRVKPGWYPLKVEYFERRGYSTLRLLVGPDKRRVRPVRAADLCCRK